MPATMQPIADSHGRCSSACKKGNLASATQIRKGARYGIKFDTAMAEGTMRQAKIGGLQTGVCVAKSNLFSRSQNLCCGRLPVEGAFGSCAVENAQSNSNAVSRKSCLIITFLAIAERVAPGVWHKL